ncbi:MAG: TPM domain-containing protein [Kofleriaceae bacterium]|nr:TPM domain-containing protein [Kofleriaceae bacterium]MBP6838917.1 TPM domain-containing protein [Kofleriaceae bacterium]MBP9202474.1 TPM domain-containing protein [Kofleriaceae bacterium]
MSWAVRHVVFAALGLALLLGLAGVTSAAPSASALIADRVGVLAPHESRALEDELRSLRDADGVLLGVVLVDTTGPQSIEAFARAIAVELSVGSERAAVLVLALTDRRSRLEVSDALRPTFSDARAQAILDNVRGYLRAGDHAGAIRAVVREVRAAIRKEPVDLESPHPSQPAPGGGEASTEDRASAASAPPSEGGSPWLVITLVALCVLLGGAAWAYLNRTSTLTVTHDGVAVPRRSFWVDWAWATGKVIAIPFVILGVILAGMASASASSSSWSGGSSSNSRSSLGSSSSRSSGSSSGSSSRSSGWSGGGASSGW